jgi:DNA-binding MarR family transcriptional regulator
MLTNTVNRVDDHRARGTGMPDDHTRTWAAWELPLLLVGAFRSIVDDAHALLAQRGYPDVRPVHGFTLQAIGAGATGSEVAERLGVTKQAAARTIAGLEHAGYVAPRTDEADARRVVVTRTARGEGMLAASALAFGEVVAGWENRIGAARLDGLHASLTTVATSTGRLDLAGWLGPETA